MSQQARDEHPSAQGNSPLAVGLPVAISYSQSSGALTDKVGSLFASGWAGHGQGKNNPEMQDKVALGPLPRGVYVVGTWTDHPRLGRMVTPLTMIEGESFGRDDFWIHGPSKDPKRYGQESLGCIVVPFTGRLKVRANAPEGSYLRVTAASIESSTKG